MKLPSLDKIKRLEQEGLISVRPLDNLIICNYTPKCDYEHHWNDATMICRGLILKLNNAYPEGDKIVELVALPMLKFWNVGERGLYPSGNLVDVTEKVDGSIGFLFRHNGYKIATRGNFISEQAKWATDFLNKNYDLTALPAQYTLIFEIIYPENRIVVNYRDREDLVLLAVRDRFYGSDLSFKYVQTIARSYGFSTPKIFNITSTDEALKLATKLDSNSEGWVLRFDNGERWKVKGDAYRTMARLIQDISWKHVIEAMMAGTLEDWINNLPDDFRDEVVKWRDEAKLYIRNTLYRLTKVLAMGPLKYKKEFALWVNKYHQEDAALLFLLYEGKDVMPLLYKKLLQGI